MSRPFNLFARGPLSLYARHALDVSRSMPPAVYAILALLSGELPASAELSALRASRAIVWG